MNDIVKKCDKCGRYCLVCNKEDVIDIENGCGGNFIDTGIMFDEWLIIHKTAPNDKSFLAAMIQLKKDNIIEYQSRMAQFKTQIELQEAEKNKPKCPKCGSTNITIGQRGYSIWTGFLGSNKTVNRCGDCGYSWKP